VLGWALAVVGAVALFLGWYGVSGTPVPAKQVPYLVSGGLGGVALVVLGAAVLATDDVRRQLGDLHEVAAKVDRLYDLLTEPDPEAAEPLPVLVPGGRTWHRADCRLVTGKQTRTATEDDLAGLRPCRLCSAAA
jgi:hypothetical protein